MYPSWKRVARAYFIMVARREGKAERVNSLEVISKDEQRRFREGQLRQQERRSISQTNFLNNTPTGEESHVLHELFIKIKKLLKVGDIGYGIFDDFRKNHPNRFINMGICEQSLISVAAGMSLEGLKPWVYTITPFLIERPFEQIKLDINQQKANVKLVGFT